MISMGANFRESALGQFRAALRQCVGNACMDFGRKELRHEQHAAGSLDERYGPGDEAGPYDAAIARHSLERGGARRRAGRRREHAAPRRTSLVAWAIAQVENDSYREVLEMTYIQRLAADEIADRLGHHHGQRLRTPQPRREAIGEDPP